jgi:hypothetical protein
MVILRGALRVLNVPHSANDFRVVYVFVNISKCTLFTATPGKDSLQDTLHYVHGTMSVCGRVSWHLKENGMVPTFYRSYSVFTMVYNTENYWVSGLVHRPEF